MLDNAAKGGVDAGIKDGTISAKSGLQSGKINISDSLLLVDTFENSISTNRKNNVILFLLVSGEKFVAATIQLDKLEKNDVLKILKVLEPYENKINLLTKKDLSAGVDLGSLGVGLKDSAEVSIRLCRTFGLRY